MNVKGELEIWLDDLKNGKLIASISVNSTGELNSIKAFSQTVKNITGHHDIFIKFPIGREGAIVVKSLRFKK